MIGHFHLCCGRNIFCFQECLRDHIGVSHFDDNGCEWFLFQIRQGMEMVHYYHDNDNGKDVFLFEKKKIWVLLQKMLLEYLLDVLNHHKNKELLSLSYVFQPLELRDG